MNPEILYQVGLTLIPGLGNFLIKQCISYCGSAKNVFEATKGELLKIPKCGEKTANLILENKNVLEKAEKIIRKSQEENIQLLFYANENYPKRLLRFDDAPALLYFKGNADLNAEKSIGIVGTRQATHYGKETIEQLIEQLKPFQPLVVSGLAYGIDILAHRACVKAGIPTLGIMANGLGMIYPDVHRNTAMQMISCGGIMSEHSFEIKPDAFYFPARNRIIAGLTDTILVIEAAEKGGALITAEIANDYNLDVYAVPGNINQAFSRGCNKLIEQNKARIYTSAENFISELGWADLERKKELKIKIPENLSEDEKKILSLLIEFENLTTDEIARKTNTEVYKLSGILLSLEFQGLIQVLSGGRYRKNQPNY